MSHSLAQMIENSCSRAVHFWNKIKQFKNDVIATIKRKTPFQCDFHNELKK